MGDDELRACLAAGDADAAFARLHSAYDAQLRRFVRSRAGGGVSAGDIGQETWAAVRKGLSTFRFHAHPRTWIFTIARNKLADERRRQRPHDTLESSLLHGGALGESGPATPTKQLRQRERAAALEHALAELDDDERELLELRYVLGLKPAAIVEVLDLDLTPNALSQRLLRMTRRLRAALQDHSAFRVSRQR